MPLLRSGQILRVDPASRAAAGLIRAVAPTLDDNEHRRLEAEVVGIPATGYAGHLRDRLLGVLDRARISDPGAKERLAALDAADGPPPVEGPAFGPARDISLAFPRPRRPTRLFEATQAVQEGLLGLSAGTGQDQAEALARLRDSFTALLSQVNQQEDPHREGHSEYKEALAWAVTAAATLAKDPEARPGTPIGTAVLSTLLVPIAVRVNPNPVVTGPGAAPEETITIRAAEGVLALFFRSDWAASPEAAPVETAARGLLEHDQPAVRAVAVSALPRLLPEPAARYARISELLLAESADFLRAGLVQQLSGLLHDMPAEVDRSLAELGTTGAWPALSPVQQGFDAPSADPEERPGEIDFAVQILIGVALLSGHGKCQHLLTTWLEPPRVRWRLRCFGLRPDYSVLVAD